MSYNYTMNDLPEAINMLLEKADQILESKEVASCAVVPTQKEYLTIQEAAEFLNKEVNTLYGYTCKKKIPYIKNEGKVLFRRSDLIEYLNAKRRAPLTEKVAAREAALNK